MADKTSIEWTNATWNPVTGCDIVSPGCIGCYAMKLAGTRLKHIPSRQGLTKDTKAGPVWTGEVRLNEQWLDQPLRWKAPRKIFVCAHGDLFAENVPDEWIDRVFAVMALAPQHTFQVLTKRAKRMREYLTTPYRPGKFTTILDDGSVIDTPAANVRAHSAMCDFLPKAPPQALNAAAKWQDDHYPDGDGFMRCWPLPNVWLGVSAERQQEADDRIPDLLATPAAIRFVSAEPLLGPIDFTHIRHDDPRTFNWLNYAPRLNALTGNYPLLEDSRDPHPDRIDWIIVGGESGQGARPMHPAWARSIRDQCAAAGVPLFFKQWGAYLPVGQVLPGYGKIHGATAVKPGRMKLHYGGTSEHAPKHAFTERGVEFASTADGRLTFHLGKKAAGRLLDGVEHSEFPA